MKPEKRRVKSSSAEGQTDSWKALYDYIALAALTLIAFANSFSSGFVLDNRGLLLGDPRIREFSFANLRMILQHTFWWPTGEAGLYRPFTTLSFLFNYAVLGNAQNPSGYHWINILLHLGNVFLVYTLVRRLLRDRGISFFSAALWAVHPVLTESVTNIIGRSDLLAGMAVLGGFLMYVKATESAGRRRLAWFTGLMVVTIAGVFSKESAVIIIGVIALYELTWWKERKPTRSLLLGCVATVPPIAVMLIQRSRVLASSRPPEFPVFDNPIVGASFWTGRITAITVIPRYIQLIFWPSTLSTDYSYAQIPLARGVWQDWLACGVVLAIIGLVAALYKWNRTAFFLASFTAIVFVPTSNLLFPIGTIMAERFLYLPAVGVLACLVMAVYTAGRRVTINRFAPVLLGVMIAVFTVRTLIRNIDWQDDRALAEASVRASPASFKMHKRLAELIYSSGTSATDLDAAIVEITKSINILDSLPDAQNYREAYRLAGQMYLSKGDAMHDSNPAARMGKYQRALENLQRSIAIDKALRAADDRRGGAEWARRHGVADSSSKGDPEVQWTLAAAYLRLGKTELAVDAARQALELHPVNPEAYRQIADALMAQHRTDDAAIALMQGVLITSDPQLVSNVLEFYHEVFPNSCALTNGPNGPQLNDACDLIRRHYCAAAVEAIAAAVEEQRLDIAEQQRRDFVDNYGCPAEPVDKILPHNLQQLFP